MKIALIGPGYPPQVGGVELHIGAIAAALVKLGLDVEAWVQDREVTEPTTTSQDGVVVRCFPATRRGPFPVSARLFAHTRRYSDAVDLLHVHSFHAISGAAALVAPRAVPVVFTPHFHGVGHTPLARTLHVPYAPVGRRLFARADQVITVSNAERALLLDSHPSVADRTTTVHNGVDVTAIHTAQPLPDQPPTVLVLGRVEEYKRIDEVLTAFAEVRTPSRLVVLGDGPDRGRLERLAADSPRAADIVFLGRVIRQDVNRWLRTARCVVSMSRHEAFGIVGLEAVAAGATALLSDLPAHREVVGLAGAGRALIVDSTTLGENLAAALAAPEGHVMEVRGWAAAAQEHLAVYEAALRRRHRAHQSA